MFRILKLSSNLGNSDQESAQTELRGKISDGAAAFLQGNTSLVSGWLRLSKTIPRNWQACTMGSVDIGSIDGMSTIRKNAAPKACQGLRGSGAFGAA
ncbi:MAG: hypothetical protein EP318_01115 [Rhodobacteraceae bacterium]|nr:MAG: hypothetical protein EP318_01115 [Paracoccaceae bacterium]